MTAWKIGDNVCALVAGGGYATTAWRQPSNVCPYSFGIVADRGCGFARNFFTVWANVFDRAQPQKTRCFGPWRQLRHRHNAIQLAAAIGATVFATAGSDAKCRACEKLGATAGHHHRTEDFVAVIKEATAGKGANVILDMVAATISRVIFRGGPDGRIVQIAFLQGSKITADMTPLYAKRLVFTDRPSAPGRWQKRGLSRRLYRQKVWPLLAKGRIKPQIDLTFPLAEAAAAHRYMESSQHIGKIVLVVTT